MNIYFHSFGCKVNQSEEDYLIAESLKAGFTYTENIDNAQYIVVNTCSVTNQAEQKCHRYIKGIKNKYPNAKIIATGCAVERNPQTIKNAGAFIVVDNYGKAKLLEHIQKETDSINNTTPEWENLLNFSKTKRSRGFIKIQDGCNLKCTYCIINKLRGKSRSKSMENIQKEVQTLIKMDVKEIVIVGIHIGLYGHDINSNLNTLLKTIANMDGNFRIRISSLDPHEINNDLINTIANNTHKICANMHIPLQSGSNKILKRMGRRYSKENFINVCNKLKQRIPNITIGTDIIIGFPGEGDDEFYQTIDTLKKSNIDFIHHFPYSEHKEAVAAKLNNKNTTNIIAQRTKLIKTETDKITNKNMAKLENTIQKALPLNSNNLLCDNYCNVKINNNNTKIHKNTLYNVKLKQHIHGRNFEGEIIE